MKKNKLEIKGQRVKLILYIENFMLICEVYIDNQFVESFKYPVLELLKLTR